MYAQVMDAAAVRPSAQGPLEVPVPPPHPSVPNQAFTVFTAEPTLVAFHRADIAVYPNENLACCVSRVFVWSRVV